MHSLTPFLLGEIGPGQISSRKGNVLNSTRVTLPIPEGVTEIHYGIQAIDSGFRKGQWVFGTVEVPCAEELKAEEIPSPAPPLPKGEQGGFEGVCQQEDPMHIARLLEKQGYVTTTWAGGIVSYLPGEPRSAESAPSILATGKYLYPVFDATGTVRMWADGAGNIIARSAPGPYGEELGYFPGPRTSMLGFAGYLGDKGGSGLWHTPNRSLTNQGRFLSVDPSGTLNLHDPRTFNQYCYVAGNPIIAIDPAGLGGPGADLAAWIDSWNNKILDFGEKLQLGAPAELNPVLLGAVATKEFADTLRVGEGAANAYEAAQRGDYGEATIDVLQDFGRAANLFIIGGVSAKILGKSGKVANTIQENVVRSSESLGRLPWTSWAEYPKITRNGTEYAKIGGRLYTQHAIERIIPRGLSTEGRSISPSFIEDIISNTKPSTVYINGVERQVYVSGSVEVVTEQGSEIVVTVNPFKY